MNKTVNINLGGLFFYIDEDAFQKMTRYFNAIKQSLNNSNSQDEIIKDIEMRIAELISEKHTSDKQVISMQELDEVIAVMGQPEDYRLENDDNKSNTSTYSDNSIGKRKLYRDRENGMIGGVLSGLGYYLGVEKVWLRLALLALLIFGGTGFVLYVILWIVIPEATTTSEKIEMQGQPVNLSNIEKQVREGFDVVSDKIQNADYNKFSKDVGRAGSQLGDIIISLLGVFAKIIGGILFLTGFAIIILLLIAMFSIGTGSLIDVPWQGFMDSGNFNDYPLWTFGFLMLLAVGIPFFILSLLGLKLMVPSTRSIGNIAKYTLIAVWILTICILTSIGITQARSFSTEGRIIEKQIINTKITDTLKIKFVSNTFYATDVNNDDFAITKDEKNKDIIYSTDVNIEFLPTDEAKPYIEINKSARGKNMSEARFRATNINYGFKIIGNQIIFDDYLLTNLKNKFREQEVAIKMYLPKGTLFKTDKNVQNMDCSDSDFFNLHYSSDNYSYKVFKERVKCLDCPTDENEYNDLDQEDINNAVYGTDGDSTKTVSVKVNGKEILRTETDSKTTRLELNENGIITKSK